MLTVLYEKTRILWILPIVSKQPPVRIICFIITTQKNENHPCRHVRVDNDDALEKSADVTTILVEEFSIAMLTTSGDASQLNGNNERYNIIVINMIAAGIVDSDEHEKNGVVHQKNHLKYKDKVYTAR